VAFTANGHTIIGCSAKTLTLTGSSFQAVCKTSVLPRGTDTVKAAYSGDAKYKPSSGTVTQNVN
jgi:Bacterial Ig-like domain (group 3)